MRNEQPNRIRLSDKRTWLAGETVKEHISPGCDHNRHGYGYSQPQRAPGCGGPQQPHAAIPNTRFCAAHCINRSASGQRPAIPVIRCARSWFTGGSDGAAADAALRRPLVGRCVIYRHREGHDGSGALLDGEAKDRYVHQFALGAGSATASSTCALSNSSPSVVAGSSAVIVAKTGTTASSIMTERRTTGARAGSVAADASAPSPSFAFGFVADLVLGRPSNSQANGRRANRGVPWTPPQLRMRFRICQTTPGSAARRFFRALCCHGLFLLVINGGRSTLEHWRQEKISASKGEGGGDNHGLFHRWSS